MVTRITCRRPGCRFAITRGILTKLHKTLSATLKKGSPETDKKTKACSKAKKRVFDNISVDGTSINTSEDFLKHNTSVTLTVLNS